MKHDWLPAAAELLGPLLRAADAAQGLVDLGERAALAFAIGGDEVVDDLLELRQAYLERSGPPEEVCAALLNLPVTHRLTEVATRFRTQPPPSARIH